MEPKESTTVDSFWCRNVIYHFNGWTKLADIILYYLDTSLHTKSSDGHVLHYSV